MEFELPPDTLDHAKYLFEEMQGRSGLVFEELVPEKVVEQISSVLQSDKQFKQVHLLQAEEPGDLAEGVSRDLLDELYWRVFSSKNLFFSEDLSWERRTAEIIPGIVSALPRHQEFRAWVVGAGTGAEAYSLSILALNECQASKSDAGVRIFATNFGLPTPVQASRGIYPADQLEHIDREVCGRFFDTRFSGMDVVPEVRKSVIFNQHRVFSGVSFNRLDLVICRQRLSLCRPEARSAMLDRLAASLNNEGYLYFSEGLPDGAKVPGCEQLDEEARLFQRRTSLGRVPVRGLFTEDSGYAPVIEPLGPLALTISELWIDGTARLRYLGSMTRS